jgi:hypothetical protein
MELAASLMPFTKSNSSAKTTPMITSWSSIRRDYNTMNHRCGQKSN